MPGRKVRFANGGIYHIFNRTIDKKKIFNNDQLCQIFLETIRYYRSSKTRVKLSAFKRLPPNLQKSVETLISTQKYFRISILAYCIMPTHFHLLITQVADDGLKKSMSDSINSFTRYFNTLTDRVGPVFLPSFRAKQIMTDEQLIHVFRYILLNPYSSGLIDKVENLRDYFWSAHNEYIFDKPGICNKKTILPMFSNEIKRCKDFIYNHADWQRSLEEIKYLDKWKI